MIHRGQTELAERDFFHGLISRVLVDSLLVMPITLTMAQNWWMVVGIMRQ